MKRGKKELAEQRCLPGCFHHGALCGVIGVLHSSPLPASKGSSGSPGTLWLLQLFY